MARPAAGFLLTWAIRAAAVTGLALGGATLGRLGVDWREGRLEREAAAVADAEIERLREAGLLPEEDDPEELAQEVVPSRPLLRLATGSLLRSEDTPDAIPLAELWRSRPRDEVEILPAGETDRARSGFAHRGPLLTRAILDAASEAANAEDPALAVDRFEMAVDVVDALERTGFFGLLRAAEAEPSLQAWVEAWTPALGPLERARLLARVARSRNAEVARQAFVNRGRYHAARLSESPAARLRDALNEDVSWAMAKRMLAMFEEVFHTGSGSSADASAAAEQAPLPTSPALEAVKREANHPGRLRQAAAVGSARFRSIHAGYLEALQEPAKLRAWVTDAPPDRLEGPPFGIVGPLQDHHRALDHRTLSRLHIEAVLHHAQIGSLPSGWDDFPGGRPVDAFGQPMTLTTEPGGVLVLRSTGSAEGGGLETRIDPARMPPVSVSASSPAS